jgi:superfamily I DNA/RNA helicase
MTRARIGLHLSWARSRLFKGRMLELQPSSFLSRLEELVPLVQAERHRERDPQLGLFPS